jgi:hypothetical protein
MTTDFEQLQLAIGDARRAVARMEQLAEELRRNAPAVDLDGHHSQRAELLDLHASVIEDELAALRRRLWRGMHDLPLEIHDLELPNVCAVCGSLIPWGQYCDTCKHLPSVAPHPEESSSPTKGS